MRGFWGAMVALNLVMGVYNLLDAQYWYMWLNLASLGLCALAMSEARTGYTSFSYTSHKTKSKNKKKKDE